MAWNEPGGGGKDPWGGGQGDGPPDLDEALKKLRENFGKFGGAGGGTGSSSPGSSKGLASVIIVILLAPYN